MVSVYYLRQPIFCLKPDCEVTITLSDIEREEKAKQLMEALSRKERVKISLGLRQAPEPPRTMTKIVPGVFERLYIVQESGLGLPTKYYEPFTNTELIEAEIMSKHYITLKDIDPRVWAIQPFVEFYMGEDGGYLTEYGDYEGRLATYNPDDPQYCHFRALKDNEEYKSKICAFFDSLRIKSKQLQPKKPDPEEELKDFLASL